MSSKKEAGFPKGVCARSTNIHESCGSIGGQSCGSMGGESNLLEGSDANYMTLETVAAPCFNLSFIVAKT